MTWPSIFSALLNSFACLAFSSFGWGVLWRTKWLCNTSKQNIRQVQGSACRLLVVSLDRDCNMRPLLPVLAGLSRQALYHETTNASSSGLLRQELLYESIVGPQKVEITEPSGLRDCIMRLLAGLSIQGLLSWDHRRLVSQDRDSIMIPLLHVLRTFPML